MLFSVYCVFVLDSDSLPSPSGDEHTLANVPLDALVGNEGRVRTHSLYHDPLTHQDLKGMAGMEVRISR